MAENWDWLLTGLRLPRHIKSRIAAQYSNNPDDSLLVEVEEWLKGVHNVQKYGHPSWRTLVQAVADPAGGANPVLAHSIAAKHPGNHSSHATESLVVSHKISPFTSASGGKSDDVTVQIAHHRLGKGFFLHDCIYMYTYVKKLLHLLLCHMLHITQEV